MIADRSDFKDVIARRHGEATSRIMPMARLLAGAAPLLDKLGRTPEWERYCTYLRGVSEQFAARKQAALQRLGDPAIIRDEEVRKLRQDVFEADVWVSALRFAVELPAAIVQGGAEAEKFIAEFQKKNEPDTGQT